MIAEVGLNAAKIAMCENGPLRRMAESRNEGLFAALGGYLPQNRVPSPEKAEFTQIHKTASLRHFRRCARVGRKNTGNKLAV